MGRYSPWMGWVAAVVVLLGAMWLSDRASKRANVAEGRVLVADSLRLVAEGRSRADSVLLEASRTRFVADSSRLATERLQAARTASRAAQTAQETVNVLRESLDAQQTVLLDSIEASHGLEVRALTAQIAQADSSTLVEHNLRLITEQALASERASHQADAPLVSALREQIAALKSANRWDGIKKILEGAAAGIVVGHVLLH